MTLSTGSRAAGWRGTARRRRANRSSATSRRCILANWVGGTGLLGQSVAERDDLDVRGRQTVLEVLPTARESQHLDDGEEQQADHREDRQVAQLWIHVRLPGTIGQDCAGHATGIVTIAPGVKAHRPRAQLTRMTTFPRARIVSR